MVQCRNVSSLGGDDWDTNVVTILTRTDGGDDKLIVLVRLILFDVSVTRFVVRFHWHCVTVTVSSVRRVQDFRSRECTQAVDRFTTFLSQPFLPRNDNTSRFSRCVNRLCGYLFSSLLCVHPEQVLVEWCWIIASEVKWVWIDELVNSLTVVVVRYSFLSVKLILTAIYIDVWQNRECIAVDVAKLKAVFLSNHRGQIFVWRLLGDEILDSSTAGFINRIVLTHSKNFTLICHTVFTEW